jgi:F-type H+-transporting ATPase subunit b
MTRDAKFCWRTVGITVMAAVFLWTGTADALAADDGGGWRSVYDLIMRWVNFALLAFVIVKFARRPLKNFLDGKSKDIAVQIRGLEEEKEQLLQKVRDAQKDLETNAARLEEVKQRIVRMGERRKQEIIAEAQKESRIIMDSAQQKIEGQIIRARNTLRAEMVDAATEKAHKKLPGLVTADDNQKLLEQFLFQVAGK